MKRGLHFPRRNFAWVTWAVTIVRVSYDGARSIVHSLSGSRSLFKRFPDAGAFGQTARGSDGMPWPASSSGPGGCEIGRWPKPGDKRDHHLIETDERIIDQPARSR